MQLVPLPSAGGRLSAAAAGSSICFPQWCTPPVAIPKAEPGDAVPETQAAGTPALLPGLAQSQAEQLWHPGAQEKHSEDKGAENSPTGNCTAFFWCQALTLMMQSAFLLFPSSGSG